MPTCCVVLVNGSVCSRSVPSEGDVCWQHKKLGRRCGAVQGSGTKKNKKKSKRGTSPYPQQTVAHKPPRARKARANTPRMPITHEFVPQSPRAIRGLSGIISFAFYPDVIGRRILITGERHSDGSMCRPAPDTYQYHTWLRDLTDAAPECVDVLIEDKLPLKDAADADQLSWQRYVTNGDVKWSPHIPVGEHRYNDIANYGSTLTAVSAAYDRCYSRLPSTRVNCAGAHVRFHDIDLRRSYSIRGRLFWNREPGNLFVKSGAADVNILRRMLEYLTGLDKSPGAKALYDAKIRELADSAGITDYEADDILDVQVIHTTWDKAGLKLDPIVDVNAMKRSLIDAEIKYTLNERKTYTVLSTFELDLFALFRMFMMFDEAKMPRGPEGCRSPEFRMLKNIIFHAGDAHSIILKDVLDRMFGATPSIDVASPDMVNIFCVTLPNYFDYFTAT